MGDAAEPSSRASRLRVAGAWTGVLDVPLDAWSVADLRAEVSRRSGFGVSSINLISAGRVLKDDDARSRSLKEVGLGENSKLLLTRVGVQQASSVNVELERSERLARIKSAADAMAKRSNEDAYPSDNFDLQLENQSGEKLKFSSENDRRALVMGLMLHSKARDLLQQNQYIEALEVLAMAEESFLLCDRKFLEAVDNVALLQIDTVWCLFMLRDIARLAVARDRLAKARDGLCRSHGRDLERLRVLQGGFCPELALYVRLELLEGVVAFHSGLSDVARQSLLSAQSKYQQLQVSDEALALLAGMGFSYSESRRALRVSGQDMQRAAEFVMDERQKRLLKSQEDRRRQRERRQQKKYGKTVGGKAVDIRKLGELASMGYNQRVVAEALKQSENDKDLALEMLMNPTSFATLQTLLGGQRRYGPVDETALAELMSMGFDRKRVLKALQGTLDPTEAIEKLLQNQLASTSDPTAPSNASAAEQGTDDSAPESPTLNDLDDRDEEMEVEIAQNLTGDPLAEYDIEVDKEGEAISEYLLLLNGSTLRTGVSQTSIP